MRHALAVHIDPVPLDADEAPIGEGTESGTGALVDQAQLLDSLPQRAAVASQDRDWLGVLQPPPLARLRPRLERAVRQLAHLLFRFLVGFEDGQQVGALAIVQGRRVLAH